MARTNRTFRPRFDTLETRDCLSANLVDGTLFITGNDSDNTVVVTQDDDLDTISVVENNGAAQPFASSEVDFIHVELDGGADRFTFQLGDADFERQKSMFIVMGDGDDSVTLKLHKQLDDDNASIKADLEVLLGGEDGKDKLTAKVGKIDHADVLLQIFGGRDSDKATVKFLGDLDDARAGTHLDGGLGNDQLSIIANADDMDIDENSNMVMSLDGGNAFEPNVGNGFDTNVAVFVGGLDGRLFVRSDGGTARDTVVANLIIAGDSDGQLDAIIRGGANFVVPGGPVLLDVVALTVQVDPNEVTVLNLLQLQD